MSTAQNGKGEIATQALDKEKTASGNKRAKAEHKAEASKKRAKDSDDDEEDVSDASNEDNDDFFNAITKFPDLKAGRYYKIVRLTKYRNRRKIAVPVMAEERPVIVPKQ